MFHFQGKIKYYLLLILLPVLFIGVTYKFSQEKISTFNQEPLKEITLSGEKNLPNGLIVEDNEILIIKPGTKLAIGKDQQIIVKGKIIAKGSKENPIIFKASENFWRGIIIEGKLETPDAKSFWDFLSKGDKEKEDIFFHNINNGNFFEHCEFKDLATPTREFAIGNKWKAAIEAYNTAITVSNSTFDNILHIGGVLSQRSFVNINKSEFKSDTIHKDINLTDNAVGIVSQNTLTHSRKENKPCADGIWIKDSALIIAKNKIFEIADDAIQGSNSRLVISENIIEKTQENGIDLDGKDGFYIAFENNISNIKKTALMVSDEAKAILASNTLKESDAGLLMRDGAKVSSSELLINNTSKGIVILQDIPCAMTNNDFLKIRKRLENVSEKEFSELHLEEISEKNDLMKILEKYYEKQNGLFIINEEQTKELKSFKLLSELFRLADIYSIPYIQNRQTEKIAFCQKLKNHASISGAIFENNDSDIEARHDYRLQISDTIFSNENAKGKSLSQATDSFHCQLTEQLNISATRANLRRIHEKL